MYSQFHEQRSLLNNTHIEVEIRSNSALLFSSINFPTGSSLDKQYTKQPSQNLVCFSYPRSVNLPSLSIIPFLYKSIIYCTNLYLCCYDNSILILSFIFLGQIYNEISHHLTVDA